MSVHDVVENAMMKKCLSSDSYRKWKPLQDRRCLRENLLLSVPSVAAVVEAVLAKSSQALDFGGAGEQRRTISTSFF